MVFLNGISGLPAGAELQRYLPDDVPIISIQAPDLTRNFSVKDITERAIYYLKTLIFELDGRSQSVHLVGYSGGGPLAFEIALQAKTSTLECKSLCLIDPTPYPFSATSLTFSLGDYLKQCAEKYDMFSRFLLGKHTGFEQVVSSNEVRSVGQLEQHVLSAMSSESLALELSCIVDTAMKQTSELMNRDLAPHRKYTGPCAFLKADPDFYVKAGIDADHIHHPDGVYGWSLPLSCPDIKAIPLACGHLSIFKDGEAVGKVASTILSLLNMENIEEAQSSDPEPHVAEQVNILPKIITKD